MKSSKKQFFVTVCNITKQPYSTEYKSIYDYNYNDFVDYIWASCCFPLFTTIVEKENYEYVDGGTLEGVPLNFTLQQGCKDIDVYLHQVKDIEQANTKIVNTLHFITRIINLMRNEIRNDDLDKYINLKLDTNINLNYLPYDLKTNCLVFNHKEMSRWIEEGYNYMKSK